MLPQRLATALPSIVAHSSHCRHRGPPPVLQQRTVGAAHRTIAKAKSGDMAHVLRSCSSVATTKTTVDVDGGEEPPTVVWTVYLSGEIHSDWRDVVSQGVRNAKLPVRLTSPNTVHEDSDDCGAIILGMEDQRPNWDRLGAKMNQIRTQTLLQKADVVVVKFGDKYKQWNAAYDAGYAAALGKPLITLHPPSLSHMLKEVNASAHSVCEHPHQVVQTLAYVIRGDLPAIPKDGDLFVPIADRLGKGNPNP